jgi:LysM repeat protein
VPDRRSIDRRRFLKGVTGAAGAFALDPRSMWRATAPPARDSQPSTYAPHSMPFAAGSDPTHLAWVWQFEHDGEKEQIRSVLAEHGLGVVVKTHDGLDWMADFDRSADAVDGPSQVAELAAFFEGGGVPFHAWSVVHGTDPLREAAMNAEVLAAGARSMVLDVESHRGFWRGNSQAAVDFGRELRRLRPASWLSMSIDPRPWEIERIPIGEFSNFVSEISPQIYWRSFESSDNIERFAEAGYVPGIEGVTPRFVLDAAIDGLDPFGLPVHPIGEGQNVEMSEWGEFINHAYANSAEAVSVWRFGVTDDRVWSLLSDRPPQAIAHIVQAGDSLSMLADRWKTTVEEIADANGIANPNMIQIGMRIQSPSRSSALPPLEYTVEAGDTLGAIADRYEVSTQTLVDFNEISDANLLSIGDVIRVPRAGAGPIVLPPLYHTVQPGDSLTAIASGNSTSIDAIMQLNLLFDANRIFIGQELRVR